MRLAVSTLLAASLIVGVCRDTEVKVPPRRTPAADPAGLAALVVDPFARVGCRGIDEPPSVHCARPECDCRAPVGLDPCFVPDSCGCFCAGHFEADLRYTPPR